MLPATSEKIGSGLELSVFLFAPIQAIAEEKFMIQDLTLTSLVFYLGHHARCLHLRAAQRLANIEDWSPEDALS